MNSIPEDEVAKLDQLADSINTEVSDVALMQTGKTPSEQQYDWQLIDLLLDAQRSVFNCFDRVATQEDLKEAALKLKDRVFNATNIIKKSIQHIQASQAAAQTNAADGSSEAVEKLKKRLQEIETDISDKDQ